MGWVDFDMVNTHCCKHALPFLPAQAELVRQCPHVSDLMNSPVYNLCPSPKEMTGIVDMMQMMKRDTKATKAALAAKAKTTAASSFLSVSVNNAAADTSDATGFGGRRNTFLQESLQPSLLDNTGFAELSATKSMLMPVPPQSLGTSMAASFSGHRSVQL